MVHRAKHITSFQNNVAKGRIRIADRCRLVTPCGSECTRADELKERTN